MLRNNMAVSHVFERSLCLALIYLLCNFYVKIIDSQGPEEHLQQHLLWNTNEHFRFQEDFEQTLVFPREPNRHIGISNQPKLGNKGYFATRISRYPNSSSSFQMMNLAVSGDINPNPGPEKCSVCTKIIAKNHRVTECESCKYQCHIKCGNVKPKVYEQMKMNITSNWTCPTCILINYSQLPFHNLNNSGLEELYGNSSFDNSSGTVCRDENYANKDWRPEIMKQRLKDSREILMMHLNVNSLQNKKEEVEMLIHQFKAQVVFLTETKLDASYSSLLEACTDMNLWLGNCECI